MLNKLLVQIENEKLVKWILSNPRNKVQSIRKMTIRPLVLGNQELYQIESFTEKQAFHENLSWDDLNRRIIEIMDEIGFKQWQISTGEKDYHVLMNKKGALTIKATTSKKEVLSLSHNVKKEYIFSEGEVIPFLVSLGIMTDTGKVISGKYNKFKQINRYVELVEDVMDAFDEQEVISIIDFGSGKSYLTFALYHYLVFVKNRKVNIMGLDLKADVIAECQRLTDQLGYKHLSFRVGDINNYEEHTSVDMVITLHACNTATDAALKKAVEWGAKVIMSVPCCHKEMNQQVKKDDFYGLFEHGIVRERVSALFTDAIRGKWLDAMGYQVQLLEFIDMAHTPKNIMIRGIKKRAMNLEALKDVVSLAENLNVDLSILH